MVTHDASFAGSAGRHTVAGAFNDPAQAERALNDLRDAGFSPDQVSVVAQDRRETKAVVENSGMGGEAPATGAIIGGITGGVLGWLVGIGALFIPGIGPLVAAGALATTLGGAALGAAAGGLIGALVEAGVPEDDARVYEEHVKAGRMLLTVDAHGADEATRAQEIFGRNGGTDVRAYAAGAITGRTSAR